MAYPGAVLQADSPFAIQVNPQDPALTLTLIFQIDQLKPLGLQDGFDDLTNFLQQLLRFQPNRFL
jgi:hypothetical protein